MAKSQGKGGGPGTYTNGSVRCTMDPPFKSGKDKGSQSNMTGTFDKPRSGGDNGLPTTVNANLPRKAAPSTTATSARDSLGTILT